MDTQNISTAHAGVTEQRLLACVLSKISLCSTQKQKVYIYVVGISGDLHLA